MRIVLLKISMIQALLFFSFKSGITLGSQSEKSFLLRSNQLKLGRASNLLHHQRQEYNKHISAINDEIVRNQSHAANIERESNDLTAKWLNDLSFFNEKILEKQLLIENLIQERDDLYQKTAISKQDAQYLNELNLSIESYQSCLSTMIQNGSGNANHPTKLLISEYYKPTLEHLEYLKKVNQDEHQRLLKKLNERKNPILVEAHGINSSEDNFFDHLEDQCQEMLSALFSESETAEILLTLEKELKANSKISRFQIFYNGAYIISLRIKGGHISY